MRFDSLGPLRQKYFQNLKKISICFQFFWASVHLYTTPSKNTFKIRKKNVKNIQEPLKTSQNSSSGRKTINRSEEINRGVLPQAARRRRRGGRSSTSHMAFPGVFAAPPDPCFISTYFWSGLSRESQSGQNAQQYPSSPRPPLTLLAVPFIASQGLLPPFPVPPWCNDRDGPATRSAGSVPRCGNAMIVPRDSPGFEVGYSLFPWESWNCLFNTARAEGALFWARILRRDVHSPSHFGAERLEGEETNVLKIMEKGH